MDGWRQAEQSSPTEGQFPARLGKWQSPEPPCPCRNWFVCSTFGEPQRRSVDRCGAGGSRAGAAKVLIRMLAALVGVGVWLVGSVEEAARGLAVCRARCPSAGSGQLAGLREG